MARYTYSVNGTALSTTTGLLTAETTATGAGSVIQVLELMLGGEQSASTPTRMVLNRPDSGGGAVPTGARTAQTAEKTNPASGAASHFVDTAFASTQGTLATNDVLSWGFNAFGGVVRWVALPGEEIVVGTQGAIRYLIWRSRSGTPTCSGHMVVEEL